MDFPCLNVWHAIYGCVWFIVFIIFHPAKRLGFSLLSWSLSWTRSHHQPGGCKEQRAQAVATQRSNKPMRAVSWFACLCKQDSQITEVETIVNEYHILSRQVILFKISSPDSTAICQFFSYLEAGKHLDRTSVLLNGQGHDVCPAISWPENHYARHHQQLMQQACCVVQHLCDVTQNAAERGRTRQNAAGGKAHCLTSLFRWGGCCHGNLQPLPYASHMHRMHPISAWYAQNCSNNSSIYFNLMHVATSLSHQCHFIHMLQWSSSRNVSESRRSSPLTF